MLGMIIYLFLQTLHEITNQNYLQNPAIDKASMLASVPPATITSASPC